MLPDARIPLRIVTVPGAGWRGSFGRPPALAAEADGSTVLVASVADRAALSLPAEGWAAVRVPPSNRVASSASGPIAGHATGCACCVARPPLAVLLSELFQQRARGTLPLFRRVLLVMSVSAESGFRRLATDDRLVSALFRLEQP